MATTFTASSSLQDRHHCLSAKGASSSHTHKVWRLRCLRISRRPSRAASMTWGRSSPALCGAFALHHAWSGDPRQMLTTSWCAPSHAVCACSRPLCRSSTASTTSAGAPAPPAAAPGLLTKGTTIEIPAAPASAPAQGLPQVCHEPQEQVPCLQGAGDASRCGVEARREISFLQVSSLNSFPSPPQPWLAMTGLSASSPYMPGWSRTWVSTSIALSFRLDSLLVRSGACTRISTVARSFAVFHSGLVVRRLASPI